MDGFSKVCHTSFHRLVLFLFIGIKLLLKSIDSKAWWSRGCSFNYHCVTLFPLLKRGDSPRSTVEPRVDGNLKQQTQRSIRSFKPHVHLNDCLSDHPVLISHPIVSKTFIFEEIQHIVRLWLVFQAKHEGFNSRVDLPMETKAQFFLSIVFIKGYRSISQEAWTVEEACLSSFIHLSVFTITSFSVFTEVCSVFTDCNVPNKALDYN